MAAIGDLAARSYARLGLTPDAPAAEIRRAYRKLVMCFHPDHAGDESTAEFVAIKAAYELILAQPAAMPVSEWREQVSGWPGGRWYWEGLGANAAKRAHGERMG